MKIQPEKYILRPTVLYTFLSQAGYMLLMGLIWFGLEMGKVPQPYKEIILAVLFLIFVYRTIYAQSFSYTFEADQIVVKYGIINIHKEYIELFRIKDFNMYRSFLMRMIGVMQINIYSSDVTQNELNIRGVPKSDFITEIRRLVLQGRRNNGVYEVD